MTPTTALETGAVLAAARAERAAVEAAEVRFLQRVLEWARLHEVTATAEPDGSPIATYGDTAVSLAGVGAPHVAQFAVLDFGATLGMSRRATEALFAEVIELGHRLPQTWTRVLEGS